MNAGEINTIIVIGLFFFTCLASFIVYFIVFHRKKQYNNLLDRERMLAEFNQTLLQSQLEIQEQTMKHLSQEIHDNVGQILTLAKLQMNQLAAVAPAPLTSQIEESRALVAKAIQDLRQLARGLDTDYIRDMGLIRAIEHQVEQVTKNSALQVQFTISGTPYRFSPQTELIVYRMQQEIIHNVMKHAAASHLDISYHYTPGYFESTITDDGVGFVPANPMKGSPTGGLGLGNLQNRAQVLGGRLMITSHPGTGTSVHFILPAGQAVI